MTEGNSSNSTTPRWAALLPCLAVALLLRLFFFSGPSLFDDVNYWMQTIATGLDGAWPPECNHWQTRTGFVLPCALLVKVFGLKLWVPYIFTLLGGLAEIALTYFIAREFVSEKTARLAMWLCAFFPLNLLFSTYLYVDLWSGVLGALAIWWWWRALKSDRPRDYLLASLFLGLGWLFRETVVMLGPIMVALWVLAGRWCRPKVLWTLLPAPLVVLGEALVYQLTAHNWHYRLDAVLDSKSQMLEDIASGGGFLLPPVKMLIASHELGLFLLASLSVAIWCWRRVPKPLVLWLGVGFVWFAWGTTTPAGWVTMQRDPRYLSVLTIPAMTLLALWLDDLPKILSRNAFLTDGMKASARNALLGLLLASGILCTMLDAGHVKLTAHRKFVASKFNTADTALEPNVYFGARASQDFAPASFACVSDLGRNTTVKLMPHLPGSRLVACGSARYLVLSSETQPEKWRKKLAEGWVKVEEIPCDPVPLRALGYQLAGRKPAKQVGLVVLENPGFKN